MNARKSASKFLFERWFILNIQTADPTKTILIWKFQVIVALTNFFQFFEDLRNRKCIYASCEDIFENFLKRAIIPETFTK